MSTTENLATQLTNQCESGKKDPISKEHTANCQATLKNIPPSILLPQGVREAIASLSPEELKLIFDPASTLPPSDAHPVRETKKRPHHSKRDHQ
ncbi:MAG: hypothetical protein ACOY3I_04370 [Verrucomicrobiota bacterium]